MADVALTGAGRTSRRAGRRSSRTIPCPGPSSPERPTRSRPPRAAIDGLPGHRLVVRDDPELAGAVAAEGAELVRASALMVLRLPATVPVRPTDVVLTPLRDDEAPAYADVMRRAYPPGHPDHEHGDVDLAAATATIRSYLTGEVVGPLLDAASAEARSPIG